MKAKNIRFFQTWLAQEVGTQGPDLDILPFLFLDSAPEQTEEFLPIFQSLDEWLTVVGEGQRDHPPPCQPTFDATEHDSIGQRGRRRRSRIDDGFIAIRAVQRLQPAGRMKDRSPRVAVDELQPTLILQWIERVNLQGKSRSRTTAERYLLVF